MLTYPVNAVGPFTVPGFSTMSDRKPDNEFSIKREYSVSTFETEAGYERRRLRSRRPKRMFDLEYSKVNGLMKQAIENFYDSVGGETLTFKFDLTHINDVGTALVRFDGALDVKQVLAAESNALLNFYTVSFKLQEVFD